MYSINEINDLELITLSCLIIKPELMNKVRFEDKHIMKHQNLWKFMKAFYKKFGNFDPAVMFDVCNNNWKLVMYIDRVGDLQLTASNFEEYQDRLIEKYEETKKDDYIIDKLYDLNMNLICRNVKVSDYKYKVDEIFNNADKIYDKENK